MKNKKNKKTVNQILVTESIIVTPELKKKRTIYKFNFFLSCFLACTLFSVCIYAEYDRNKSEQVSQDILEVIIIDALASGGDEKQEINLDSLEKPKDKTSIVESIAPDGKTYYTQAILKIPSLDIEYPVLSESSDELLKISLNKIWGPEPNEVRKLCNCRTQL